jgi:hypothetical protein
VSVLAHVFERAGLATVALASIRGQAVNARPPRALFCEFPLGRPLGRPNDPAFQTEVIRAAFGLLGRTDVPVLETYPEVIVDQGDAPAACPLPPRLDTDGHPAASEARGLRDAYQRNLDRYGRTSLGRIAGPDEIPALLERIARIEQGETLAGVELDAGRLIAATQDVRAYYEEAGLQLADVTGARQLETWFFESTEAGQLLVRVQGVLAATSDDAFSRQYMMPFTQSRRARGKL